MNHNQLRFFVLFALTALLCAIISAKVTNKHVSEMSQLKRAAAKAVDALQINPAEFASPSLTPHDRDMLASALPIQPEIDALIEQLVTIFADHSIDTFGWNVHTSTPTKSHSVNGLTQVAIDIGFSSNHQTLSSVLHALRNTPRFVLIDRISVAPAPDSDPSQLTVNLRIAAFSRHDPAQIPASENTR